MGEIIISLATLSWVTSSVQKNLTLVASAASSAKGGVPFLPRVPLVKFIQVYVVGAVAGKLFTPLIVVPSPTGNVKVSPAANTFSAVLWMYTLCVPVVFV